MCRLADRVGVQEGCRVGGKGVISGFGRLRVPPKGEMVKTLVVDLSPDYQQFGSEVLLETGTTRWCARPRGTRPSGWCRTGVRCSTTGSTRWSVRTSGNLPWWRGAGGVPGSGGQEAVAGGAS